MYKRKSGSGMNLNDLQDEASDEYYDRIGS